MAKVSTKSPSGTSFHDTVIITSVKNLKEKFGLPIYEHNDGNDKTNFDWVGETSTKSIFTIYDYKEYSALDEDKDYVFHIGGDSKEVTELALKELRDLGL